jgi:hypothetical protein
MVTVGNQAVHHWEDVVMGAEALRLADVTVMDIYTMQASPSGLALTTALTLLQSAVEEWIDFTISVQERQ